MPGQRVARLSPQAVAERVARTVPAPTLAQEMAIHAEGQRLRHTAGGNCLAAFAALEAVVAAAPTPEARETGNAALERLRVAVYCDDATALALRDLPRPADLEAAADPSGATYQAATRLLLSQLEDGPVPGARLRGRSSVFAHRRSFSPGRSAFSPLPGAKAGAARPGVPQVRGLAGEAVVEDSGDDNDELLTALRERDALRDELRAARLQIELLERALNERDDTAQDSALPLGLLAKAMREDTERVLSQGPM